jgi:hypothetical protein
MGREAEGRKLPSSVIKFVAKTKGLKIGMRVLTLDQVQS